MIWLSDQDMRLPKRPAPYILALLIIILALISVWMLRLVTAPEIRDAVRKKKESQQTLPAPAAPSTPPVNPK